jgi:hypothetical protein
MHDERGELQAANSQKCWDLVHAAMQDCAFKLEDWYYVGDLLKVKHSLAIRLYPSDEFVNSVNLNDRSLQHIRDNISRSIGDDWGENTLIDVHLLTTTIMEGLTKA